MPAARGFQYTPGVKVVSFDRFYIWRAMAECFTLYSCTAWIIKASSLNDMIIIMATDDDDDDDGTKQQEQQ
jgi:hypothetical protein